MTSVNTQPFHRGREYGKKGKRQYMRHIFLNGFRTRSRATEKLRLPRRGFLSSPARMTSPFLILMQLTN